MTLQRLHPRGLPKWAGAYWMNLDSDPSSGHSDLHGYAVTVQGAYRGVLVGVIEFTMTHDDTPYDAAATASRLTSLLNTQVSTLEAAP